MMEIIVRLNFYGNAFVGFLPFALGIDQEMKKLKANIWPMANKKTGRVALWETQKRRTTK